MSTPITPVSSPYRQTTLTLILTPKYVKASARRLQSLFSDLSRKKQSDPSSYQASIEWWRKSLESYVFCGYQESHRVVLHAEKSLIDAYRIEGVGKPIGLGAVVVSVNSQTVLAPTYWI